MIHRQPRHVHMLVLREEKELPRGVREGQLRLVEIRPVCL